MRIMQAKWVLNLVFIAMIARTVFGWYEIATVYGSGEGGSLIIRVATMTPALIAIFLTLLHHGSMSLLPKLWRFLFRWAALTFVVGMVMGMSDSSHSWRYILADAFRYGVSWGSLYACLLSAYFLIAMSQEVKLIRFLDKILILSLADAIAVLWLSFKFPSGRISSSLYIFAIIWGTMFIPKRPFLSVMSLFLGLGALLVSGKRGPIISVALITPLLFFLLSLNRRLLVKRFVIILFIVASVSSVGWAVMEIFPNIRSNTLRRSKWLVTNVLQIITDALAEEGEQHATARIFEVENIMLFYHNAPALQVFGAGFGAEIPMVYSVGNISPSGRMHHVHIAWAAYFLRNGVNGVLLLAVYFAMCLVMLKKYSLPNGQFAVCLVIFASTEFITAFKGNIMLEALPIISAIWIALSSVNTKALSIMPTDR